MLRPDDVGVRLADGKVVPDEDWVGMVADAEKSAAEAAKTDPSQFDIATYSCDLRPYAAIAAARILVTRMPEKAMEMLWALEARPGLVPFGYASVFETWYATDKIAATDYLMRQNLASMKWTNTLDFVAREWARDDPDLFVRFLDVIPSDRRDDAILAAVLVSGEHLGVNVYGFIDGIRDQDKRRFAFARISERR